MSDNNHDHTSAAEKAPPAVTLQPETDFDIASSEVYIDKVKEKRMMRKFDVR